MPNKLLLIDGHNILWRAWGVPFSFSSSKGVPLHVVTGFLGYVRRAIDVIGGEISVLVVFDSQGATDNHLLSVDYKSNRKIDYAEDEDSPYKHLPYVKAALDRIGVCHSEINGHEADDIIATVGMKFLDQNKEGEVFVLSTDTDFYQLVDSNFKILRLKQKKESEIIDAKRVKELTGVTPKEYAAYKSLVGDTADNIKGVKGVGPVRAAKFINKEIDLDLEEYRDVIDLNMKLIVLNIDVPVDIDLDSLACVPEKVAKSNKVVFDECGF